MATKLCLEALHPALKAGADRPIAKALAGTVHGDVHDIGKNIVVMFLEASGFQVIDLGIDVAPEQFVKAARRERPDILLLSCLYTVTMHAMEDTIIALRKAGLKRKMKILVGGAPITPEFAHQIGADGYGADAVDGVRRARELLNR
jgi:methanogenic corrinoid protein MtbC1